MATPAWKVKILKDFEMNKDLFHLENFSISDSRHRMVFYSLQSPFTCAISLDSFVVVVSFCFITK